MQVGFPTFSALQFSELATDNIILREAREADPSKWLSSIHYEYSKKTLTTSLRPHIEKHHLKHYLTLAKKNGWKILLLELVSQARSQATNEAATSQHERSIKFDENTFHQHLLNFIVTDDQVCSHDLISSFYVYNAHACVFRPKSLNLVECPEFRQLLLLLRNNLNEAMISC